MKELFRSRTDGEVTLFETLGNPYCRYFRMDDFIDYYNGVLMPSTGYVTVFDLIPYYDGMLLRMPDKHHPDRLPELIHQDKMFGTFNEFVSWNKLMHVSNVGEFNVACKKNQAFNMIKLSEALQEKKVSQIADMITNREGGRPKFVLVSGPSSSGKTTFSKRLSIQLMVNGLNPVIISMDNYLSTGRIRRVMRMAIGILRISMRWICHCLTSSLRSCWMAKKWNCRHSILKTANVITEAISCN